MRNLHRKRLDVLFKEIAGKFPNRIAIAIGKETLTYKELDDYSDYICNYITKNKLSTSTYIGVCFKRSSKAIIHILGILKAGYAYIPIDSLYPEDRINYIINDSKLNIIFSDTETKLEETITSVDIVKINYEEVQTEELIAVHEKSDDAYVIYTSGTTGKPKGVVIQHQNVMRLFSETKPYFNFSENDKWTLFHSLSFDFSVWEVFGALLHGGELVVVPFHISRNPKMFLQLLKEKEITILNQTPTAFSNLILAEKNEEEKITSLRTVIFGGEKLDINLLKPWVNKYPLSEINLINMYGITETTVHVTYRKLKMEDFDTPKLSPIGLPISDLEIYLLDENDAIITTAGKVGEMYIAGAGLAKEYLNKPELTQERFLTKTLSGKELRIYKTGDEAYFENGEYFYIGRNDNQVQLNGFRIELDEISSVTLQNEKALKSVVLVKKIAENQEGLFNYILTNSKLDTAEKEKLSKDVFAHLREKLPNYMIPYENIVCDEFPLTSNGKLDKKALKNVVQKKTNGTPEKSANDVVKNMWKEVLQTETVNDTDDFFDLGGTSLSLIQLLKKVKDKFGVQLNTSKFVDNISLGSLQEQIDISLQPATTTAIAETIWKDILNIEEVPKEVDFFDLGGTSLSLILLFRKTQTTLGVKINTADFSEGLSFDVFVTKLKEVKENQKIKKEITLLWEDVLGTKDINDEDDFFDIGGTSLSLILLLKQVKDAYGVSINASKFTEGLTKKSFIQAILNGKSISQKINKL